MATTRRNQRRKTLKKNPTIEEENTPNIPCEIIESILLRLPVKSLLRFKSVSKPWYSLISDAKFARFHLHQSNKLDCKTISMHFGYPRQLKHHFLKFTNQNYQLEALEFPLKKYREARVFCSCDGLVLLKNIRSSCDKMCVLWNPATRTYTKFSCPYPFLGAKAYGLCYDASSDDYKVVLEISSSCYAIFSHRNNSWTEKYSYSLVGISGPGLFVNGALHWIANESLKGSDSDAIEGEQWQQLNSKICTECRHHYVNFPVYECGFDNTCEICCFDPINDKFKKLSKPACFDISYRFELTELEGQLCLYRKTYDLTMIEVWMMKEYGNYNSWTKYLTIENLHVPHHCYHVKLLCSTNDSNVFLDIHGSGMFLYNHKQNKLSEIDVLGEEYLNRIRHMTIVTPLFCWNDSLILPNKINRTKKKQNGKKNFM